MKKIIRIIAIIFIAVTLFSGCCHDPKVHVWKDYGDYVSDKVECQRDAKWYALQFANTRMEYVGLQVMKTNECMEKKGWTCD